MRRVYIMNVSPLITLGRADLLTIISPLTDQWIIPEGVAQEVQVKRPLDSYLSALARAQIVQEKVLALHPSIAAWDLGQGESEVLTLAMGKPEAGVVIDDLQARKCARLFNLPLLGSIGLIFSARRQGIIPLAKPAIDRLIAAGLYVDPGLITRLLREIGEIP